MHATGFLLAQRSAENAVAQTFPIQQRKERSDFDITLLMKTQRNHQSRDEARWVVCFPWTWLGRRAVAGQVDGYQTRRPVVFRAIPYSSALPRIRRPSRRVGVRTPRPSLAEESEYRVRQLFLEKIEACLVVPRAAFASKATDDGVTTASSRLRSGEALSDRGEIKTQMLESSPISDAAGALMTGEPHASRQGS